MPCRRASLFSTKTGSGGHGSVAEKRRLFAAAAKHPVVNLQYLSGLCVPCEKRARVFARFLRHSRDLLGLSQMAPTAARKLATISSRRPIGTLKPIAVGHQFTGPRIVDHYRYQDPAPSPREPPPRQTRGCLERSGVVTDTLPPAHRGAQPNHAASRFLRGAPFAQNRRSGGQQRAVADDVEPKAGAAQHRRHGFQQHVGVPCKAPSRPHEARAQTLQGSRLG